MTDNINRALNDWRMPLENRELIREMCSYIGIAEYKVNKGYIRATRVDAEKPALLVRLGYTEGFVDADEAREACGDRAYFRRAEGLQSGDYIVEHPVNRLT